MTELIRCKECGFEQEWEDNDFEHGHLWSCDECMEYFCAGCFIKEYGEDKFFHMINNQEKVLCKNCYRGDVIE